MLVKDLLLFFGSYLEGYAFLRIRPFPPSCPFYWHIVVCSGLLWSFVFLRCCNFSYFISIFIDLSPLPLFRWWIWLKVFQFCQSSQRNSISFHWSLLLFSWSLFHLWQLLRLTVMRLSVHYCQTFSWKIVWVFTPTCSIWEYLFHSTLIY